MNPYRQRCCRQFKTNRQEMRRVTPPSTIARFIPIKPTWYCEHSIVGTSSANTSKTSLPCTGAPSRRHRVHTFITGACDEKALLRFPIASGIEGRSCGVRLDADFTWRRTTDAPSAEIGARELSECVLAAGNVVLLPLYRRLSLEATESIARRVVGISEESRGVGT